MIEAVQKLISTLAKPATFILLIISALLAWSQFLLPADRLFYNSQIKLLERKPVDDIIIIAIDKTSLHSIGRWPWSRNIHAQLINKISEVPTKAVVMDILFSEESNQLSHDAELVDAVKKNGNVIFPVAPESVKLLGQLSETLPFPALLDAAAGIGHIDRELDTDSVSRRTYLFAGIGYPRWPNISVEAMRISGNQTPINLGFNRTNSQNKISNNKWIRSNEYLTPYLGRPGSFPRISYKDVLDSNFDISKLANKYVLVGATAHGLGDIFSTPVTGENSPMPGVEMIANDLDGLLTGKMISSASPLTKVLIACFIVLLTIFVWPLARPRFNLFIAFGTVAGLLMLLTIILAKLHIWLPAATLATGIVTSYIAWSWQRLVETVSYLDGELSKLNKQAHLSLPQVTDASKAMEFMMKLPAFYSGELKDNNGNTLSRWHTDNSNHNIQEPKHIKKTSATIHRGDGGWQLALEYNKNLLSEDAASNYIENLAEFYNTDKSSLAITPVEYLNNKISQVQSAYSKTRFLNTFISETLDQLYHGLIVTDNFGNVLLNNKKALDLTGFKQQQIDSLSITDLIANLNFNKEHDWSTIFSDVLFDGGNFEAEAATESGTHLLIIITRHEADEQIHSGMVINYVDVTKLKQTEKSRRELLAFLSHDLRSPLASLIATSDLARIRPEFRDTDNFINSIKQNAHRALNMADNFLTLMRAESIDHESFNKITFNPLVTNAAASVEYQAIIKNITVVIENDPNDLQVYGDASILERVLINLLTNSVKFSPKDSKISIGCGESENLLHCWVKDTGYGIPQEKLEKIFEPFNRVDNENHRDETGTGLGLTFVQSSVERHQGRIEVESEVGSGSCFNIYLPLIDSKLPRPNSNTKTDKQS